MEIHYRLIQYQPDPLFPAPVTVGVIAWTGSAVGLRLLGQYKDDKALRPGAFVRAFRLESGLVEIVYEWLHRFVEIQRRYNDGNIEKLITELDELDGSSPFTCEEAGEIDADASAFADVMDDIYRRAVLNNTEVRKAYLEDQVESIIEFSEAFPHKESLIADAEIELLPKGKLGRGLLSFLWFYDAEPRSIGVKVLDFGQDSVSVGRQVAEAINCFEVAISRKVLEPRGCIIFHDATANEYPQYLRWIQSAATTIDINSEDALWTFKNSILS